MKPLPDNNGMVIGDLEGVEQFQRITNKEELKTVIDILRARLPNSAHVYNMALMASMFSGIETYSYRGDLSENSILMLNVVRPDFGQDVNISAPEDIQITEDLKRAFSETSVIDWNEKYIFCGCARPISQMILEISTIHKNNGVINNPNYYYYMGQEEAAALEFTAPPGVKVHSLDTKAGVDLLVNGWKYQLPGTPEYAKDVIENGFSSGVYVDRTPIAGVIQNPHGLFGMLYTAKGHRNAGYGKLCVQNLMKELGKKGFVVASCAECKNEASNKFHLKLGMKMLKVCDYIFYTKSGFES